MNRVTCAFGGDEVDTLTQFSSFLLAFFLTRKKESEDDDFFLVDFFLCSQNFHSHLFSFFCGS